MIPLYADCKYAYSFANTGADNSTVTNCHFFFLDPCNFDRIIADPSTTADGHKYWFSNIFKPLMGVYAEALIRTTVLKFEITAEYAKRFGSTASSVAEQSTFQQPVLQLAWAPVPLNYLRKATGAGMAITDAGTLWIGVDYYSALTQMPGARNAVIPLTGDRTAVKGQMVIDGYDHDGSAMSIRSEVTWSGAAGSTPTITLYYPSDGRAKNVFLFAFRTSGVKFTNITQDIHPRFCYKMENHLTFMDSVPPMPYITTAVA